MSSFIHAIVSLLPLVPHRYRGTSIACRLCGSVEASPLARFDRHLKPLRTVVCNGCGLIRSDPMPDEAELAAYYRDRYRLAYQFAGRSPPRRHRARTRAEAQRRVALLAPTLPAGRRVLDFGSGSGEFLAAGEAAGWEMEGVEPGAAYAGQARAEGLRVHPHLADVRGEFDAITAHHVIEHLRDPLVTLREAMRLLKPDGLVYVSVPDMGPSSRPAFDRLHFAHVHGFVPATLDLMMARLDMAPDPRFARDGTTAVFSRRPTPARADPSQARRVLAGFNQVSPWRHALTFAWVRPALARWKRDLRDSLRGAA